MIKTIHARLVAFREEFGGYIIYVFENLDKPLEYELCIRLPNWQCPHINLYDSGYLTLKEVIAGKDTWYNVNSETETTYNYTTVYFINFIHKIDKDIIL